MVKNLKTESLPKIRAIKEVSEIRSGVHNLSLRITLRLIDNVICEAEDVLDEYKYKHLEQQVLRKQHACVCCFYSYKFLVHHSSRLEEVVKQLEQISYSADNCISRLNDIGEDRFDARVDTTSYLYEEVFGRDKEIKHVTKLLTTHPMLASNRRPISDADEDEHNYETLPIIGVEGVGKTVLAKSVYHHSEISQHFDLRVWIHALEDFDEVSITTSMIQLVSKQSRPDTKNLDELQKLLSEHIRGKKFLLVLDDVWYDEKSTELENKVRWMRVRAPLRHGQPGSRILVTSTMKLVAKMFTCTIDPVVLGGLQDAVHDGSAQPLPLSITQLHLGSCFVDDSELLNCISKLTSLTHLVLAACHCITTLPSEEVLRKLTQLQELRIEDCVLLTSLGGLRALPSLRVLNIRSCPNLLALIPSEGSSSVASALLPESLIDLEITDCELMTNDLINRCLRGLTRLKHLSLQQLKHITSFPSDDKLSHLTSIESLTLKDYDKLVSMGGLHVLSSISSLHVNGCPGLLESDIGDGILHVPNITVDNLSLLQALFSRKGLASLQVLTVVGQEVPFTPKQEDCLELLTSL
ncbi:uncharacterized protein LOC120280422 [Dioscorea cayenensis subsp. rotundata]|uniref:Uncharacterized protein LOC120280422 n=1 Tax=Dioscorea cayennensis subsp. rotundata TaxID=55577 RepID=A0AB40CXL3_DIOCR|nr:uncharacterized protein LOC120280422 [Dioscorea cayenensis subsp. rotundata]